jgi:hypothetical protein
MNEKPCFSGWNWGLVGESAHVFAD